MIKKSYSRIKTDFGRFYVGLDDRLNLCFMSAEPMRLRDSLFDVTLILSGRDIHAPEHDDFLRRLTGDKGTARHEVSCVKLTGDNDPFQLARRPEALRFVASRILIAARTSDNSRVVEDTVKGCLYEARLSAIDNATVAAEQIDPDAPVERDIHPAIHSLDVLGNIVEEMNATFPGARYEANLCLAVRQGDEVRPVRLRDPKTPSSKLPADPGALQGCLFPDMKAMLNALEGTMIPGDRSNIYDDFIVPDTQETLLGILRTAKPAISMTYADDTVGIAMAGKWIGTASEAVDCLDLLGMEPAPKP